MDGSDDSTASMQSPPSRPGMIGDYRLLRKIGEGGMGVVYEAEQQNPRRVVALKVIRGGAYVDEHVVKLFRREAQALARLKHPGIAAIYESGRTDEGQHFFAMELARGETLGSYLKRRPAGAPPARPGKDGPAEPGGAAKPEASGGGGAARRPEPSGPRLSPLELRERLALFRKVCDAVSYAHQRGVIHRDLKPSNILVQRESASPASPAGASSTPGSPSPAVPDIKILDFGLARITDSDVAMSTVLTDAGRVQGTLPYMSPEQVRGHTDEIDLRSDVYSLGVILYEMVSGQLPLRVTQLALPEAMRVICEDAPQPLTRTFSGTRRLDADVGTIVQKALEKEPARRYQSAAALSEDLQRYLTDQPILARPPSAAYQFRKLVARHKAPFAFLAAIFVLLLGFAVTMTVQAGRIARERDRANAERDRANREAATAKTVSEFLVGLFQVSDPTEARGRTITAKEILDTGAGRIEREMKGQPLVQASLMNTMGRVYVGLGLYDRARPLLEGGLKIRREILGAENVEVAQSLSGLGWLEMRMGRLSEATALLRAALETNERLLSPRDSRIADSLYALASVMAVPKPQEAVALYRRALDIYEIALGPDSIQAVWCLNDIGIINLFLHDYSAALGFHRRALTIRERLLPPSHPDIGMGLNNVGYDLVKLGRYDEGRVFLERAVTVMKAAYGTDHPETALVLQSLGEMWLLAGEPTRALNLLQEAVAIQERHLDPSSFDMANTRHSLAVAYREVKRFKDAEEQFQRALAAREQNAGFYHPEVAETLQEYAKLLRLTHRDGEAASMEARAEAIRAKIRTESPTGAAGPDAGR